MMENFLKKDLNGNMFELCIDHNIFSKDIVLKAAYNFLDRGYFFFKVDENKNIVVQCTKKEEINFSVDQIVSDFSDELLSVYLRDILEKDNKVIREKIVSVAIGNSLDANHFVRIDTDKKQDNSQNNQIDFDKDIDDILREIENDPDLKIDEEEIERILKEIEEETEIGAPEKPTITLDPNAVKNAKKIFQDR